MDKNKREMKKSLEFPTFSSIKREGAQSKDFPVPPSQYRPFDESRPSRLGLRRRASTFENDQTSDDGFIIKEFDSKTVRRIDSRGVAQGDNDPVIAVLRHVPIFVGGGDYEGLEIDAAGETVPCSHEDEEIGGSLKPFSSTTILTNEDERDNVSLSSEESEVVSDVGLIDDLSIGHLELESARQDKNDLQPTVRFPGNENFSCIEIEEDTGNDMRQTKETMVVRERQINDIRASPGSNNIAEFCSRVHQIENENSNYDHKDALEWGFLITNFLLELPSAILDHFASVHKPQYALSGILISVAALLLCAAELVFKARKEKVTWEWRGRLLPCFYSQHNQKLFHTFKDNIIGVVVALCQFIIITINYAYLRQGAGKPIQICVWPIIFFLGQMCSKIL